LKDDDVGDLVDDINATSERPDHEFSIFARKKRKRQPRGSKVVGPKIQPLEAENFPDHFDDPKGGDDAAIDKFYRCFHKLCKSEARKFRTTGVPYAHKLSAAVEGLFVALRRFNPRANNRFTAFVRPIIRGAIADCVTDWHFKGIKNESRAARKDRSAHRPKHATYNAIEERRDYGDADGNKIVGWIQENAYETQEWEHAESSTGAKASLRRRLGQRLRRISRNLGVPRSCYGVDENPHRNGRYKRGAIGTIDYLARESDRRERLRFMPPARAQVIKLSRSHNAKARMASLNNGVTNGQFGVSLRPGGDLYRHDGSYGRDHWQASGASS
jgi:hypothetical protein